MEHALMSAPADLLVGALTIVVGALAWAVRYIANSHKQEFEGVKISLGDVASELQELKLEQKSYATLEQLGRFGDRFDQRVTAAESKIAVALDRFERSK